MNQQHLLQKGDIFRLEKGMNVYAFIPEKFSRCSISPFSNQLTSIPINVGEILYKNFFLKKEALIEMLTEQIKSLIKSDKVTDEKVLNFINSLDLDFSPEEFDTFVFVGEYQVYKVEQNVGWHVFCKKVDSPEIRVHFFQT